MRWSAGMDGSASTCCGPMNRACASGSSGLDERTIAVTMMMPRMACSPSVFVVDWRAHYRHVCRQFLARLLRSEICNPWWHCHGFRVRNLSARLRNVDCLNEALGFDVPQLLVRRAPKVNWLLPVCDAGPAVREGPLEDGEVDSSELVDLTRRIDDQLEGDIVRRATVREHRLGANRRS